MATGKVRQDRVTAPELEQYILHNVHQTGVGIGVGAYGSVEEVEIPGALVAAKKLHPQLVTFGSQEQVLKWISDFVAECKLMSQLRHPHIVQFLGVCYLPGSRLPVLLMEKLQTSLDSLLETNPDIPMDVKVFLLTGTCQGVVYLHSRTPSVAHRDLTARNILIDSGLTAKIADLGVAKMVNIQPGQLAATMTRAPGNVLYMPPEAVQEERATRYSTAIDIFSFGVISLFTLTQTFPKDLKSATYRDPSTRRIVGRSEIERREEYIQLMKTALGKTHPIVQLTLNCLEYDHEDRPSAIEVLRQLEEVRRAIPQNCTETKLELIQRISVKEQQLACKDRIVAEKDRLVSEKDRLAIEKETQNEALQAAVVTKQAEIEYLHSDNVRLQADIIHLQAEKQEQVHGFQELTTLQQQQLEVQSREIDQLSGQLRTLELGRRALEEGVHRPQGSGQRDVPVPKPRKKTPSQVSHTDALKTTPTNQNESQPRLMVPSSITINWRWKRCKDIPQHMKMNDLLPAAHNGKIYTTCNGGSSGTPIVLDYTPLHDEWSELPPLPVYNFSVATLRSRLLAVGGSDKSTHELTDTILTYDDRSRQWIKSLPALPTKIQWPAVVGYQDHLIVMGGGKSSLIDSAVPDVNVLDTTSNKWITAESLPITDDYKPVLIEDTIYLVGQRIKTVLRAHVPTLVSQVKSDVWELEPLPNAPLYRSSPIKIGNTLSTMGGARGTVSSSNTEYLQLLFPCTIVIPSTAIHLFEPTGKQWMRVGDLPVPMFDCCCIELSGQLFVLGGWKGYSSSDYLRVVYTTEFVIKY